MSEEVILTAAATGHGYMDGQRRFVRVRNWDNREQALQTLYDCGFPVSESVRAAAAAKVDIGYKIDRHSLDRVLAGSTLKLHERIGLKTALARHGFIAEDKR